MIAHRYIDTRLALVGDAAHGVHPIAGQGLNLGFRDISALGDWSSRRWGAARTREAPLCCARYQAARRPDNLPMLAATDALDRLFSNDILPVCAWRATSALPRCTGFRR